MLKLRIYRPHRVSETRIRRKRRDYVHDQQPVEDRCSHRTHSSKNVPSSITAEKILTKLRLMNASLKRDFGIAYPKIAVLGLNPHCGDDGLLGDEEETIIALSSQGGQRRRHHGIRTLLSGRILRSRELQQVRCDIGNVPRPGTCPVQGARLRRRCEFHRRTPGSKDIAGPRHGIFNGRTRRGGSYVNDFRNICRNRHLQA